MKRILAIAALSLPLSALSADAEFGMGVCEMSRPPSGTWWVEGGPTSMDLTSACWQIGLKKLVTESVGWRVAYVGMGRQRFANVVAVRDDEQTLFPSGENCTPDDEARGCVATFAGDQEVHGVSLGGVWQKRYLSLEAGMFVYWSKVDLSYVTQWGAQGRFAWHAWGNTPYAGAALHYGPLALSGRMYSNIKSKTGSNPGVGPTDDEAYQIGLTVSVPIK